MITNKLKVGFLLIVALLIFQFSCDIANNDIQSKDAFIKIFHNQNLDLDVYPVDVKQTNDGDYLVLSSVFSDANTYVWHTVQITKTNEEGTIIWQTELEAPYVNPVGEILKINEDYFFFCMNQTTLISYLMKINLTDGTTELKATFDDISYPLCSFITSNNEILLLGYNHYARKTIFAKINSTFETDWLKEYYLIEDAEEMLISHIIKQGKQFPFLIGELLDGNYFLNGFYNYSFSTLFISKSDGSINGLINGFRYEGAVSSFINLQSNTFALSTFNQGDNHFLVNQEISTSTTSSIESLQGVYIPELQDDASVVVKNMKISNNDVIVFATSTKNGQIVIYFYDKATYELLETKNISDTNPVEVKNIIQTTDNGIAIVGRTFVNGQFSRTFFVKLTSFDF